MLSRKINRFVPLATLTLLAIGVSSFPYITQASSHPQHRANLQLCVQNLDGTPTSRDALGKITAAFNRVKTHPSFKDARLDRGTGPTIVAGCPGEATIKSPTWAGPKEGAYVPPTNAPSEFQTFVFIVPEAEAQRAFGDVYPRITTQEMMCVAQTCGEVSAAVYVTPTELDNFNLLARSLSWGVGLIPEGEKLPTE